MSSSSSSYAPNKNTALILNNLVQIITDGSLNNIYDIALSSQELALGHVDISRQNPSEDTLIDVDLCIGLNIITDDNQSYAVDEVVLSQGLVAISNSSTNLIEYNHVDETGFVLSSLLGLTQIQNCYAFGSIYLEKNGNITQLNPYIAKGYSITSSGSSLYSDSSSCAILMSRDLNSDEIINLLNLV